MPEKNQHEYDLIKQNFDEKFYLAQLGSGSKEFDLVQHYLDHGWLMGLNPNTFFDTQYYLARSVDVSENGINPFFHYIKWGKFEGRFANPDMHTIEYTADELLISEFFDREFYVRTYPEIKKNNVDPLKHYVHFGWRQGFNPSENFSTNDYIALNKATNFDITNPLLHKVISERKARYLQDSVNTSNYSSSDRKIIIFNRAMELRNDARSPFDWEKHMVVPEFIALNPNYRYLISDYEDAIAVFECFGIDELAALSFDAMFDFEFYTIEYEDAKDLGPSQAYRHWLEIGITQNRACSEESYIKALTGQNKFPNAFDWHKYQKQIPNISERNLLPRWKCLQHLLERGYSEGYNIPLNNGKSEKLFEIIADRMWTIGQKNLAIESIKTAIVNTSHTGEYFHKLGDFYNETSKYFDAAISYSAAIENNYANIWTYANLIRIYIGLNNFDKAYDLISTSKSRFEGSNIWKNALDHLIRMDFDEGSRECRSLFASNNDFLAEKRLKESLDRVCYAIKHYEGLPAKIDKFPNGPVIFFALTSVPQCKHYRVDQRIQQFQACGVPYKLFTGAEPVKAKENLIGARALLIYREPAFTDNIRLILHARALGVPVFFDIDDLIFNLDYYPDSYETYRDQIDYDSYIGLKYAVPLYRYAIELSDYGISSTSTLSKHIEPLVREKKCFYLPNGIDVRNESFLSNPITQSSSNIVRIFYGSGAKAHNRNFNEFVAPALGRLLAENKDIEVFIAGYLTLSSELQPFLDRVIRIEFTDDIIDYWALLQTMDINIATLIPGEMNDCKSEIKWIEAACCGVSSVMSASAVYRDIIIDGYDGLIVNEQTLWYEKLKTMINSSEYRYNMAVNARVKVKDNYSIKANSDRIISMFSYINKKSYLGTPIENKMRALIVNVLFHPQTYGGATRVVESEVNDLNERYKSEIEVAIFSTDYMGTSGTSKVDNYKSMPIFRYAPMEHNPELYDEKMPADYFAKVVDSWRPDVVHFHSIQYLSGSIVRYLIQKNIPYVVTIHDGWWFSKNQFFIDEYGFLQLPSKKLKARVKLTGEFRRNHVLQYFLRKASAITTVSQSFAAICKDAGFDDIIVLENGTSIRKKSSSPLVSKNKGKAVIGFVGGKAIHKGYAIFKGSFLSNNFSNISVLYIDHEQNSDFRDTTMWGSTEVKIIGLVPQDKMDDFYESLDILCAPSTWPESFGLVAREASEYGLWVIANKIGSMGSNLTNGKDGFVIDTSDTKELTECLMEIDSNPYKYRERLPTQKSAINSSFMQTDGFVEIFKSIRKL